MSHLRWCVNVADEQAGCNATPVLLLIFWCGWQIPQELQTCSHPDSTQPPSRLHPGMPAKEPGYELRWESMRAGSTWKPSA
jgi:hypothetical protein